MKKLVKIKLNEEDTEIECEATSIGSVFTIGGDVNNKYTLVFIDGVLHRIRTDDRPNFFLRKLNRETGIYSYIYEAIKYKDEG